MITKADIFREEHLLCIAIADVSVGIKGYDTTTERTPAILYKAGKLVQVNWFGTRLFKDQRCLCFDDKPFENQTPIPASELATSLRAQSFELLANLSKALQLIDSTDKDFLAWNFFALPLSSFYFLPDGSVLLLSKGASQIIDLLQTDQDRFLDREIWYVHDQANDFGKANFLFQLVYYALTGLGPYQPENVRNTGFKPIPISLYFDKDPKYSAFLKELDGVFRMKRKDMYQVSNPYEYFNQVLSQAMSNTTPNSYIISNSKIYKDYLQKLNRKANRNIFFRKKGALLTAISVAAIIILAIAGYYLNLALSPPETAGCGKAQIVSYYYKALNNLDISGLEDSLAHGCESPDSMDVISLTVTSKTRQTYENVQSVVAPQKWLEEGMPALIQGGMVYGVANLEVQETAEDVALATFDYYRTYDASEDETEETTFDPYSEQSASTQIAKYRKVVKFTFVEKKAWLEISEIEELESTLVEVYEVPYVEKNSSTSTMLLTTSLF